jgi:MFS family permease
VRGGLCISAGLVALLLGLTLGGTSYAWASWQVVGLLAAAVVILPAFVAIERRQRAPLLDPRLFANRAFALSIGIAFVVFGLQAGVVQLIPLFVQGALGLDAQAAGVVLMPAAGGAMIGAIVVGQTVARTGRYKPLAVAGACLLIGGYFLLHRLTTESSYVSIMVVIVVLGVGQGCCGTVSWVVINAAFPHRVIGAVNSTRLLSQNLGQAIAVAVMTLITVTIVGRELTARVPAAARAVLARHGEDPRTLVTPAAQRAVRGELVSLPDGANAYAAFARGLRESFAIALTHTFAVAAAVAVLTLVLALLLPTFDLEGHEAAEPAPDAAAAPGTGA